MSYIPVQHLEFKRKFADFPAFPFGLKLYISWCKFKPKHYSHSALLKSAANSPSLEEGHKY